MCALVGALQQADTLARMHVPGDLLIYRNRLRGSGADYRIWIVGIEQPIHPKCDSIAFSGAEPIRLVLKIKAPFRLGYKSGSNLAQVQ